MFGFKSRLCKAVYTMSFFSRYTSFLAASSVRAVTAIITTKRFGAGGEIICKVWESAGKEEAQISSTRDSITERKRFMSKTFR